MPGAERRHTLATKQDTGKFSHSLDNKVETPEQEFEINSLPAGALNRQKLTRSTILTMQRTIGNQAVMRILERSHANPPARPLEAPGAAMLSASPESANPLPTLTVPKLL